MTRPDNATGEEVAKATALERPIFIVGAGRSGTTLLRSLLSAHPRIAITTETHFMQRWEIEGGKAADAPSDFEAFWARYTASTRFQDLEVDADECLRLVEEQGERTFQAVFAAILSAYRQRSGKPRVGEKTPGHVFYLSRLLQWFPDARVIFIRRDPRAVIASQLKTPWNLAQITPVSLRRGLFIHKRLHEVAVRAGNWSAIYEDQRARWEADPRVLSVAYESLARDTEVEVRRICDFVGEAFEPEMLLGRDTQQIQAPVDARPGIPREWLEEHHARTLKPVTTGSFEKWKQDLTPGEVAMIESRCIRGMRAAGYPLSTSGRRRLGGRVAAKGWLAAGHLERWARSGWTSITWRRRQIVPVPGLQFLQFLSGCPSLAIS